MTSRDFRPSAPDAPERGHAFRTGNSRRVELTLKQELDDVAKKTVAEIVTQRELEKQKPLPPKTANMKKLAPEFIPQRLIEKRKTHPIFHEDSRPGKTTRVKSPNPPEVPPYNALNREDSNLKLTDTEKPTKKLPFSRENTITTKEMKKAHQTSVGVVPPRQSDAVQELKVVMEGKPVKTAEEDPVIGPVQRANTIPELDPILEELARSSARTKTPGQTKELKPAILASTGTTGPAAFTERPPPQPKPPSNLRGVKRARNRPVSAGSNASSFKSVDIPLSEAVQYDRETAPSGPPPSRSKSGHRDDMRSASTHTVKSVKDLVDEAKKLAAPDRSTAKVKPRGVKDNASMASSKSTWSRRGGPPAGRGKGTSTKSTKSGKSGKSESMREEEEPPERKERTVDEIIASLKDTSTVTVESEADKKIKEIMARVVSRTNAVLGDLGTQVEEDDAELATELEEVEETQEVEGTAAAEEDTTQQGAPPVPAIEVTEVGGQGEGDTQRTQPELTGEAQLIQQALNKMSEDPEDETYTTTESDTETSLQEEQPVSLEQAYQDLIAPMEVTYEDICSVEAKPAQLHTKHHKEPKAPQTEAGLSFLGTWTPVGSSQGQQEEEEEGEEEPRRVPDRPPRVAKNIHHFCKVGEDVQLPDHFRGVWRRFHVPSKYDYIHMGDPQEGASMSPSVNPAGGATALDMRSTASPSGDYLERQRSAKARQILTEVNQLGGGGGGNLAQWEKMAQNLFDQSELSLDGKKMELKSDESFLYWTPAPPKFDVAPNDVKRQLFPSYGGAALAADLDAHSEASEESDIEDTATEVTDPEDRLAKDRILSRTYGSARDLTLLSKEMLKAPRTREHTMDIPTKEIEGSLRVPGRSFVSELEDKESEEYHFMRKKVEDLLGGLLKQHLGEDFVRISGMSFGSGSLVVNCTIEVLEDAPGYLPTKIREVLAAASANGELGSFSLDSEALSFTVAGDDSARDSSLAQLTARFDKQRSLLDPRLGTPRVAPPSRVATDLTAAAVVRGVSSMVPHTAELKRRNSAPGLLDDLEDDNLMIYQDFGTTMEEIQRQKKQLRDMKAGKKVPNNQEKEGLPSDLQNQEEQAVLPPGGEAEEEFPPKRYLFSNANKKEDEPTPAELALEAGRNYVLLPKKKKKSKIRKADMARIEQVEEFLARKGKPLQRSNSLPRDKPVLERELRVPGRVRTRTRRSIPDLLDFDSFKGKKRYQDNAQEEDREFVRDVWDRWFDQTFPPTPSSSEWSEDEQEEESVTEEKPKRKNSVASTVFSDNIEVNPIAFQTEEIEALEMLEDEVERLDVILESTQKPNPFDLCRRGAILRKLGKIKPALDDLTAAIQLEPLLLDAYWHRHLILILQNKRSAALDDLNYILKINKNHSQAFRSRGIIHKELGDITMAVVNYTQAIKNDPTDDEAYFQRAEMYEARGEMLLAMEDYAMATKLCPQKTDALFKHGMHYFNNGNWSSSIEDFTNLLRQDPYNTRARLCRGRAYSHMKNWTNAVEDLSATIHLDPKNAKAYYYRGCLLRKLHPKKALQDYSVSLLLDDSDDNIMAFLHRGILYYDIKKYEDAIPDFEAVLKLDKDCACAHTSLGLIFMNNLDNHHRAIKKFSAAIKSDPTYVKALICRAEAYQKVHDTKNALLDITRAIHLRPDLHHLYMYRGQLVLKLGNLELASFCVQHASELGAGIGQSATQQAIVQSFLKNYEKAIEALQAATRTKPVPPLYMLLGKTQMKARKWKEAAESFQKALDLVERDAEKVRKPWQDKITYPPEAAEMYYLIGICQTEMRDYFNGHDAFNNAIKVDPKYADAYYHRGNARMKLKQSKGIQDFNRALALDPTLFQAYLSRAAYYGMRGQYTKAILNCNEAIRLQTNSVRGFLYRGALKYHIKAYSLAIRDLSQAITIDSTCALAYFNRAVCYHDSGNHQKALQDYGIVMLLGDELKLKVLINRGLLYYDRKDYKNALHDFLLAADINQGDKRIHHTLGLCLHKLGRLQEAVQSFTQALEVDKFFLDALISRGNVFMDFGHTVGQYYAKHDYERALHLDPRCLPARVNLAYNLQVSSKYQQAWHQFTAAIDLDPGYKPALEGRAIINLQMSDTFAAFQDITASINVKATAELLTNRGVIHQFMGERPSAMRDYQEAIKHDPTYALAYFNAANVYFHTRQFKQALGYYSQAISFNHTDESAFLNRAICKVMLRDSKGALEDFDKAIRLSPHSAHVYFNRGNLYASLHMYDKAEGDYCKALELQPDDPLTLKRLADMKGKLGRRDDAIKDYRRAIQIQSCRAR